MIDDDRNKAVRQSLSTAQVLSLLTAAVVLSVLIVAIAVTWVTLTQSAVSTAQDRLTRGVRQLTSVAATGIRTGQARYAAAASDSALVRVLEADPAQRDQRSVDRVRATLAQLHTPTDSGMPVELWDSAGRRVAYSGDNVPDSIALHVRRESDGLAPAFRPGLDSIVGRDSLQLGQLYYAGRRTHFWLAMPVVSQGRTLGYILHQRRIAANPQTEQTLRELSGDSVSGYYRNADGTAWTTFGGAATTPQRIASADSADRSRQGTGRLLFAEQRVAGTPLVIGMELAQGSVISGARVQVRRLGMLAVMLTGLAGVVAWLIGRRVAQPLTRIAGAADALASGDYAVRVPTTGTFEIARLAGNFNRMATQIGDSRSELERREEELRMVADAIPQLAWMADPGGTVLWLNQRWYAYAGTSRGGSQEAQWIAAYDEGTLNETMSRWRTGIASGQPFEMEVRLRSSDGQYRWFLTRVAPVHDRTGTIVRWFGTSTDIQSLREAREAAVAASRAKSEFLAAMSHELRTPLNAIGGYAELMELGIRGPISPEQRHDLSRIRTSQQHLLALIGSVLDLSRIESGRVKYQLEDVAIDSLLASLDPLVAPQAESKQHTLIFELPDTPLSVVADRDKLRQILLNLLSNAIRHTPPGTAITVSARRHSADMVEILVRDTGAGIPADVQQSIFEPFVQLDRSLANPAEGIGLGLAISRDLARGMNGDLTIVSENGDGASFVISLPAGVASTDL